jgi:hypothetical protein
MRFFATAALLILTAMPVWAQNTEKVDALIKALSLPDIIEIMHQEGSSYGDDIAAEMFPGKGGAAWTAQVQGIYDTAAMTSKFRARMLTELTDANVDAMVGFFGSDIGHRIIALEVTARRALMDKAIEEAARDTAQTMQDNADPRFGQLEAFAEANDLIEENVVGAMNSNYAFFQGLMDGNAFPTEMTEEQVLSDVWGQEPQIRIDTVEWLYGYLSLAYQPLSDEDLDAYIVFSKTKAGQDLNRAIFASFDVVFTEISRNLGRAASMHLSGEDI